jgi:lysophospholipase L1-like esterase
VQGRAGLSLSQAFAALVFVAALLGGAEAIAGTNRVLGDSISLDFYGFMSWPKRAFGDDQVTWAIPGASAGSYVANCNPDCPWLADPGSPDDVWWIMVGVNELERDPNATSTTYGQNLVEIINRIPAHDIRLISSPQVYEYPWTPRGDIIALLDEQAFIDRLICNAFAHVTCVADLRKHLVFETDYHWDGIHLNDAGHQRVADLIGVPEPGSALLCGVGLLWLGRWSRSSALRESRPTRHVDGSRG